MRLSAHEISVELARHSVLQGVTLNVESQEIVGLIGPNGSGKSTLLRALYRVLRPVAGYVLVDDRNLWQLSARESARQMGVVLQETPGSFELTVQEVVQMGRIPHQGLLSLDSATDRAIVQEALDRVKLRSFAEQPYQQLSGGEKQRVLIARALAQQPQILVLDEPTNHLDIYHQLGLLNLVQSLGMTTLVVLHDLNLAAQFCQRLYVMQSGRIVASGATAEILTPELLAEVFQVRATCGIHPVTRQFYILYSSL